MKKDAKTSPVTEATNFGSLISQPNCHEECRGCSESGSAIACFSCKHLTQTLRNRAGFKCVAQCDDGYYREGDKCRVCSTTCKSCVTAEKCQTCYGAKLLIDVDHYGHQDHGTCVDRCPDELEADYTIAVQARCILRKNRCSPGYYEEINQACSICDEACRICHGPGPTKCDECAENYSNRSVGYCRPCCKTGEDPMYVHCEDCKKTALEEARKGGSSSFRSFIFFLMLCLICAGILFFAIRWFTYLNCETEHDGIDYERLPTQPHSFKYSQLALSSDSESDEAFDVVTTPIHPPKTESEKQ